MGLFRKKKASQKNGEDRELISENERAVESLLILSAGNEEMEKDLRSLKEKLKYLTPSDDGKIYDYDKKIRNLIEDMRIALIKADGETNKKVEGALLQLKLTIADRNAKI